MKVFLLVIFSFVLVACETISYYSQAVTGQLAILGKREGIEKLLRDPDTDAQLKTRLENILAIRAFAESSLTLPVGKSFSTYANLERPFVVWNVFVAPEFSMTPRQWCYPIAGCVTYRGYFSEAAARQFARRLEEEGLDVYVGGVAAYSTLGWFSDPVLNTVINREEYRLAALVFHELAHQVVYVPGDTEFNESFATAVEMEGLRRWLDVQENIADAQSLLAQARREQDYQRGFVELVQSYVPLLEKLYAQPLLTNEMRQEKTALIDQLREDYLLLKQSWDGYAAYDAWFETPINNAKLNTVGTYFNQVPAFEALLAESDNDLPTFYTRVKALADLPAEERQAALALLAEQVSGQTTFAPVVEFATN